LHFEELESRLALAAPVWPGLIHPIQESEPNDTLDQAQSLGSLSATGRGEVIGRIGNGAAAASDVDWYSFTLDRPAHVTLITLDLPVNSPFVSVLSLYNSDIVVPGDSYDGHRLLAQDDGAAYGGDARLERALSAGVYYVAVSGSGNRHFHALIAGSGYPGSTGDYGLQITAVDLDIRAGDGPAVLATDPAPGADLDHSPFVLRADLSAALDPRSLILGSTVRLVYNAVGTFGDGRDQAVALAQSNFSAQANELQLQAAAPLRPGYYQLLLAGDAEGSPQVIRDLSGQPLGRDVRQGSGHDFTAAFHIGAVKSNRLAPAWADDTPATAHMLGDVTGAGLVQVSGAIGDDSTNPIPFSPADIDLYRFHVSGPGRFALSSEVFAGRIGSPLNPALTLFQFDLVDNRLHLLATNDGTRNDTPTHTHHSLPLFSDPALFVGLTAGDYLLAVSSSGNMPDPTRGLVPGTNGIFDPLVSHSGQAGITTGDYVLSLSVVADNRPPQLASVMLPGGAELKPGAVLGAPPTGLNIEFSKPVNLLQLAMQAFLESQDGHLNAIYIQAADGSRFYPRFRDSVDGGRHGEFLMLDALPNGTYQLHLSGTLGLADLAGNPLAGNGPTGDYIVPFAVNGPVRGNGNPLLRRSQEPNHDPAHPQDLEILFPNELANGSNGVVIARDYTANPRAASASSADYYLITVLQAVPLTFTLNIAGTSTDTRLSVRDASGHVIFSEPFALDSEVPLTVNAITAPGTYLIGLEGWSPDRSPTVVYQLSISTTGSDNEQPPPLTIGPGPAIRIRQITGGPPAHFGPSSNGPVAGPNLPPAVLALSSDGAGRDTVVPARPAGGINGFGSIPSSVLLALGVGPKGGISSEAPGPQPPKLDVYERVLAQTPVLPLPESLVQLPIFLQTPHSGTAQGASETSGLTSLMQEIYRRIGKVPWKEATDMLHGLDPAHRTEKTVPPGTNDPDDPNLPDSSNPSDESDGLSFTGTAAAGGPQTLLAAGLLVGIRAGRNYRSKGTARFGVGFRWGGLGGTEP
jgi:hypothetical protein